MEVYLLIQRLDSLEPDETPVLGVFSTPEAAREFLPKHLSKAPEEIKWLDEGLATDGNISYYYYCIERHEVKE